MVVDVHEGDGCVVPIMATELDDSLALNAREQGRERARVLEDDAFLTLLNEKKFAEDPFYTFLKISVKQNGQ